MTMRSLIYGAAALLAASGSAHWASAAQAINAQTGAAAEAGAFNVPLDQEDANAFWTKGALTRLSATATALVTTNPSFPGNAGFATMSNVVNFSSANVGSLQITEVAEFAVSSPPILSYSPLFDFSTPLIYTFKAQGDGTMTFDTTLFTGSDAQGLGKFAAGLFVDPTGSLDPFGFSDQGFQGVGFSNPLTPGVPFKDTEVFSLKKGVTYALVVGNNETQVVPGQTAVGEIATFDWTINDPPGVGGAGGVPEPASWTLLICGFMGLGAALRRQRRTTALGPFA